ncbi:helix-turn-helix domain-containing protein [Ralstonia pickettii]|uniref:helix-turn-helix domain-containing protein n=1 Tax=Ralstonia pickettii TaxID=329 RepID=UPI0027152135|nr:helix-turn-helix transcriptional regulator [Ralstonia pickettii]WKZ86243.1 helix-turn-helix domain-containing protein [Ralstonia pickettii]
MSFRERLKALMSAKEGATLAVIADACGCTPQAVHKWLKGGDIGYAYLKRLAAYFNVNWIWLRYGEQVEEDCDARHEKPGIGLSIERSRYLERIVESERLLRTALEMVDVGAWEMNVLAGRISYSVTARRLLGVDERYPDDVVSFFQLMVEEDAQLLEERIASAVRTASALQGAFRLKANAKVWLSLCGGFSDHVTAEKGRIFGVLKRAKLSYKSC